MRKPAWRSLGLAIFLAAAAAGQPMAKPDAEMMRNLSLLVRQWMPATMDPGLAALNAAVNRAFQAGDDTATWRVMTQLLFRLQGQDWDEGLDLLSSMQLSVDRRLAAPGDAVKVTLQPMFRLNRALERPYTVRLALVDARGREAAKAWEQAITDAAAMEYAFPARGLRDGSYEVVYRLSTPDGQTVAEARRPVTVDRRLDERLERLKQDLARAPRDDRARVRAALETAEYVHETMRRARSEYVASPGRRAPPIAARIKGLEGLAQYAGEPFDPETSLALAERFVAAVMAQRDPFAGLSGDLRLAYRSEVDQTLQPYRVYVPAKPARRLLVTLHGVAGDENTYFGAFTGGMLTKLAEERGYAIASPNGRGPMGGYMGASRRDVYEVRERAVVLFGLDERQVFLTGHSMGAMGTWQIVLEKPELWAGAAPVAGAMGVTKRLMERAPGMPVFLAQGGKDRLTVPSMARNAAEAAKGTLRTFEYREYPEADHFTIGVASLRDVFDFFDRIQPKP